MDNPVSTSSPAAVALSDGVCHFERLPTELLAVVYDLAYGYPAENDLITKTKYEQDREDLVESGELASFPSFEHHVDRFLVSKCFFLGAIEAFAKAQFFDLTGLRVPNARGIIYEGAMRPFVTSILAYGYSAWNLRKFSSLRHLEIVVTDDNFGSTSDGRAAKHRPWVHVYQDAEFAKFKFVDDLSVLRGLKSFKCQPLGCRPATTQIKRQVWEGNVSALQKYLTPIVTARKTSTAPVSLALSSGSMPLYPKSRVNGIGQDESASTPAKPEATTPIAAKVVQILNSPHCDLAYWIERALREHPELDRPLEKEDHDVTNCY